MKNNRSQRIIKLFRPHLSVSGYRTPQVQGIGLRSVQAVREQADNRADAVPCDRLP